MKSVRTIEKAADARQEHNFESMVVVAESEIYYMENNPEVVVVKEEDVYDRF